MIVIFLILQKKNIFTWGIILFLLTTPVTGLGMGNNPIVSQEEEFVRQLGDDPIQLGQPQLAIFSNITHSDHKQKQEVLQLIEGGKPNEGLETYEKPQAEQTENTGNQDYRDEVVATTLESARSYTYKDPKKSRQLLEQVLELDPNHQQGLNQYGMLLQRFGEFPQAIEVYEKILRLSSEDGEKDKSWRGVALGHLGHIYMVLGDYQKAVGYKLLALSISQEIGDREEEVSKLIGLANTYMHLGESSKGLEYYQQAMNISREINYRGGEMNSHSGLGIVYQVKGDFHRSIEHHQQSLEISREIGDRIMEGRNLGNLANAYNSLRDYLKAIDYNEQALKIGREINDRQGVASRLRKLGSAYINLGKYRQGIEYHEQSLIITREIGDRLGEGSVLGNLGNMFFNLKRYQQAKAYYQQAIDILEAIHSPDANIYKKKLAELEKESPGSE